jgi:hypothetical protein
VPIGISEKIRLSIDGQAITLGNFLPICVDYLSSVPYLLKLIAVIVAVNSNSLRRGGYLSLSEADAEIKFGKVFICRIKPTT